MKSYNFDGHKLMYHLDRVQEFNSSGDCFPLYMEISPVGSCNHRCVFCAYDYIGYPNRRLDTDRTLRLLDELAECGLKSILFAGEGEPLIHPDLETMIARARANGIDVGLFSNGYLFKQERAEAILPHLTFVRFSFNGGSAENYAAVHSVGCDVFDTVVANIRKAAEIKRQAGLGVDIGAQFVLIPENFDFLESAATTLRDSGIDYLTIKPFMQREEQGYRIKTPYSIEELETLFRCVESISTSNYSVIARRETFQEYGTRSYNHCCGTSFITVLNSAGVMSTCLPYWDRDEFSFGSIYDLSFRELWGSDRRREIVSFLKTGLEAHACPPNCRPHAINGFLWELQNPSVKHINFI